jgi:hypothetical protein
MGRRFAVYSQGSHIDGASTSQTIRFSADLGIIQACKCSFSCLGSERKVSMTRWGGGCATYLNIVFGIVRLCSDYTENFIR